MENKTVRLENKLAVELCENREWMRNKFLHVGLNSTFYTSCKIIWGCHNCKGLCFLEVLHISKHCSIGFFNVPMMNIVHIVRLSHPKRAVRAPLYALSMVVFVAWKSRSVHVMLRSLSLDLMGRILVYQDAVRWVFFLGFQCRR